MCKLLQKCNSANVFVVWTIICVALNINMRFLGSASFNRYMPHGDQLSISLLKDRYHLKIVSPFHLSMDDKNYIFDALIEGYGAPCGMLIVQNSNTISGIGESLIALGYGFSCFDINTGDAVEVFQEILDDWGKNG